MTKMVDSSDSIRSAIDILKRLVDSKRMSDVPKNRAIRHTLKRQLAAQLDIMSREQLVELVQMLTDSQLVDTPSE